MGGRGKKRREKNYLKSHGGDKRLPPPPDSSSYVDVLPSKLRQIMSYSSSNLANGANVESETQLNGKKGVASHNKSQAVLKDEHKNISISTKLDKMSAIVEAEGKEKKHKGVDGDKNKKKRKRREVNDLRFEAEMEKLGVGSKRKQRKKEFLKNKKKKQKKGTSEDTLDLPKRDDVKFGDVVQAPPKLDVVPKAPKKPMSALNERLRLQAIEAYRNRKGNNNRLGIQLPSLSASSELE